MRPRSSWVGSAHAKVNLRLAILDREPSGYHRIETDFLALELADRVELELASDSGIELHVTGLAADELGPAEENLAVRAVHALRDMLGERGSVCPGVRIDIEKRVPHGAGLGGGSSDAAAVLRGLNHLMDCPLSIGQLSECGARLGSDVPFFVSGLSRAFGRGRGDQISPLESLPPRPILLVIPSAPISTGWAYRELAAYRVRCQASGAQPSPSAGPDSGLTTPGPEPASPPPESMDGWADVASQARNDFEEALFPLRKGLARGKEALEAAGARPCLLSGSGSALFGVFESEGALATAEAKILDGLPHSRTLRTCSRT